MKKFVIKVGSKPEYEYYDKIRKRWNINPCTKVRNSLKLYNRREKHKTDYRKEQNPDD